MEPGNVGAAAGAVSEIHRLEREADRAERHGWLLGAVLGLLALGGAWGVGSLALLDLSVGPTIQVPPGVWGLGPELPRRGMFVVPMAWLSHVIDGPILFCAVTVLASAAAVAGVRRRTNGLPPIISLGAGAVYVTSPYLLTRLSVGHLGLVVAAAILPWAVPDLAAPNQCPRRAFLWSLALAACGSAGATVGCLVAGVGWLLGPVRRPVALAAITLPHLLWVVPGVVVAWQSSAAVTSSDAFATSADGLVGAVGLLVGSGFWAGSEQLGPGDLGLALAGLVLAGLAAVGASRLRQPWHRGLTVAALVALFLAVASALPGIDGGFDRLTSTALGAPLREGQRFAVIVLLWLCLAAAHGLDRLVRNLRSVPARAVLGTALCLLAVALALPALGDLHDRLADAELADDWHDAQERIAARPGTVAALPLSQYTNLPSTGRRVLHPAAQMLDADVLGSTDPGFSATRTDESDPRVPRVAAALTQLGNDEMAADLAEVGVRWLAVVPGVDEPLERSLRSREDLVVELDLPTVLLVRNNRWEGPAVAASGRGVDVVQRLAPLADVATDGPVVWAHPAAHGWMRGWDAANESPVGTIQLGGGGAVWFWPAIPVLLVDMALIVAAVLALLGGRRTRPASAELVSGERG